MQDNKTKWIWLPNWAPEDKEIPILALFLKKVHLKAEPEKALIKISADTRYKLYINGCLAEAGPSRGDRQIWFYDEIDVRPFLRKGENVFAVEVLRYPMEARKGNHGMFRTEYPGLYVEGSVLDVEGNCVILDTDESWMCRKHPGFQIVSESEGFAPLQIYEVCQGKPELNGWMLPGYTLSDEVSLSRRDMNCGMPLGYDHSSWLTARPYFHMSESVSPGNLRPRTIPFLYRKRRQFSGVTVVRESKQGREAWEALLRNEQKITISGNTREIIEITAGEEMTAYVNLAMEKGTGAKIKFLYSEGYVQEGYHKEFPLKKNRDDWENGHLDGFFDEYLAAGYGDADRSEEYEPFWFRTFRFIRLEIETRDEPLILSRLDYTETGYPLKVRTKVSASDLNLEAVWEICERTLRRCMHETYEDCPFYEQLQYAMDARTEILYTYAVSADDRLARKCMDDFRRSQRYDGLLNCSYPCVTSNVIPGFSIYYIFMLYDHMMYFDDKELLEEHMPTVSAILNYFHRNRAEEGYVKKLGGLNGKDAKWSFIDWTPEWDDTTGVPDAILEGPITMESLLYVAGLQHGAAILEHLGQKELASVYLERAQAVQESVRRYCTGKNGMLQDGPGIDRYSQHVQVFSILTETVELEQGRKNLEMTLLHTRDYAQCSVAMSFYLFRALQKTGLYLWTKEYAKLWLRMLEKGLTTCAEDEVGERSDCHAWGSLILYELPSVVLGVQPARPGYRAIRVRPEPGSLEYAQGNVVTPKGMVRVSWSLRDGGTFSCEGPENVEIITDTSLLEKAWLQNIGVVSGIV